MNKIYAFLLKTLPRPVLIRLSYVFRRVAPIFLKGDKVQCPVCEKKYGKFLPYGTHQRDNVLCPNCLTLERHRLMWLFLNRKTDFFSSPKKVLHVAPEQCFLERFKAMKNLDYTTADLVSPIADVKMDLHDIPFEDNTFDVIFCNHVLEHVRDEKRCMRELLRVLKPGGFAILQVPIDFSRNETYDDPSINTPELREKHFWQKDHMRLFGKNYPEVLRAQGFMVEELAVGDIADTDEAEKFRLQKEEILYKCTKA